VVHVPGAGTVLVMRGGRAAGWGWRAYGGAAAWGRTTGERDRWADRAQKALAMDYVMRWTRPRGSTLARCTGRARRRARRAGA